MTADATRPTAGEIQRVKELLAQFKLPLRHSSELNFDGDDPTMWAGSIQEHDDGYVLAQICADCDKPKEFAELVVAAVNALPSWLAALEQATNGVTCADVLRVFDRWRERLNDDHGRGFTHSDGVAFVSAITSLFANSPVLPPAALPTGETPAQAEPDTFSLGLALMDGLAQTQPPTGETLASCADTDDPTPYRCFEKEFVMDDQNPPKKAWRCRIKECQFTVYEDQINDLRVNWCHRNAVGEPALNLGTAYCPRCLDETLVEQMV